MPTLHIDRRSVKDLPALDRVALYYDDRLKGFAVRVMPSGVKTYFVEYRSGHGGRGAPTRRLTLGRNSDAFKADAARDMARTELARVALGKDPATERMVFRKAETVAELLEAYMDDTIRPKRKPGTAVLFDGFINNHIVPEIGTRKAISLTRADVVKLHRTVGTRHPITANRVVSLLATSFAHGIKAGLIPEDARNPATGIERFREDARERYLTPDELSRLGASLRLAETDGLPWEPREGRKLKHAPRAENRRVIFDCYSVAAIRLLLFTGCRLREILHLKWSYFDEGRGLLFLPDSKTGRKTIILGTPAIAILNALTRRGEYVIAGRPCTDPTTGEPIEGPRSDLNRPWSRVTDHAKLQGVRLHDLRHSFASVGVGSGLGLPIIGKLLGHADSATTARYAHLDADPLRRASDAISLTIAAALSNTAKADALEVQGLIG